MSSPQCVCLTGPTACGKTELALHLASIFPVEIISMDSAMVYRGMDIGTAKPSAAVRAAVPHHLIDILEPSDVYSAGSFARDALDQIEAISARGKLPLLVGGTLLYLRALRDGLASLPRADAAVRLDLEAQAVSLGWAALHERLQGVDPIAAARIAPTDRQRIQRALEVHQLTGKALTHLQRNAGNDGERADVLALALVPAQRADLSPHIEQRFDAMVEAGFVAEVTKLRARGDLNPDMPAMRAVGYRQVWTYLEGECNWPEARTRAIAATRQLAKRQMTWLRADARTERFAAFSPDLQAHVIARIAALRPPPG